MKRSLSSETKSNKKQKNVHFDLISIGDDALLEVLSFLDIVSIVHLLSTSTRLRRLKEKPLVIDRQQTFQTFFPSKRWNDGLISASSKSNIPQIEYFIEKGADDINSAMCQAAQIGNRFLVDYFIQKGACRWNKAMGKAARGGHKSLVDLFISKGAGSVMIGLLNALKGGHRDLIKLFMKNGMTEPWSEFLEAAIESGQQNLVSMVLKKMIVKDKYDYNRGMAEAARFGHKDIVDMFVKMGADHWFAGLLGAAQGAQLNMFQYFYPKATTQPFLLSSAIEGGNDEIINMVLQQQQEIDWNDAMHAAAVKGRKDLIDLCVSKGAKDFDRAMAGAARQDIELVNFFIEKGATDWNRGLSSAAWCGNFSMVEFFVEKGANGWTIGLIAAIGGGYTKLTKYFVDKGCTLNGMLKHAASFGDLVMVKYLVEQEYSREKWIEAQETAKSYDHLDVVEYFQNLLTCEELKE